ncbi:MAG: hypothetical protein ACLUVG_16515 [Phocaeicola vulgatus]
MIYKVQLNGEEDWHWAADNCVLAKRTSCGMWYNTVMMIRSTTQPGMWC